MQKRTKLSIILLISFFIIIITTFLIARNWTKNFQEYLNSHGSVEYAKVNDVVITETKDGVKDWELYAAIAEYDTTKTIVTLTDIVGNYYQNHEVTMSFISPKGTYNTETKKVELYDSVKIVGKDDIELTANKISWVTTEDKIIAEGDIVINQANEVIALSNKGTLTKDFENVELIDNAEIRVYKNLQDKRGK